MRTLMVAWLLATSFAAGAVAFAHASLRSITSLGSEQIAAGSIAVTLAFDAAIELRFSRFALLPLDLPEGATAAVAAGDLRQAEAIAAQRVAAFRRGELGGALAFTALRDMGASREVTLTFAEPLPAGVYALAFEALAQDGHVMREHRLVIVSAP